MLLATGVYITETRKYEQNMAMLRCNKVVTMRNKETERIDNTYRHTHTHMKRKYVQDRDTSHTLNTSTYF